MRKIINIFKDNNIEYEIGIIKNGIFIKESKNNNVIMIKHKKNSLQNIIGILNTSGINLSKVEDEINYILYKVKKTKYLLLIIYAIDSHVLVPNLILKHFRTDCNLFYINTQYNKILKTSSKSYNTKFGYYDLQFEEYLSNTYEKTISELIQTIIPFVEQKNNIITFNNLKEKINNIFFMAMFRNPYQVEMINDYGDISKTLNIKLTPEIIEAYGKDSNYDIFKDLEPLLLINTTSENFVMLNQLFSNIKNKSFTGVFLPLHPKFGFVLIPKQYYSQFIDENGEDSYLKVDNTDDIRRINIQTYYSAKNNNNGDVIGIKEDLQKIIDSITSKK